MARTWTCQGCRTSNPRVKQKCPSCGRARPKPRRPKHQLVLDVPYEVWVEMFGETCGICGRPPGSVRRLDRDHDHATGGARGLLCFRCNQALKGWMNVKWLLRAIEYLQTAEARSAAASVTTAALRETSPSKEEVAEG